MTESEWLVCLEPDKMWCWHPDAANTKRIARKVRLFAVACCRSIWNVLDDARLRTAVEVAEGFVDGVTPQEELSATSVSMHTEEGFVLPPSVPHAAYEAVAWTVLDDRELFLSEAVSAAGWARDALGGRDKLPVHEQEQLRLTLLKGEEQRQGQYLHCIFGNPFHPVVLDPSWLTTTVLALARQMYESRDFSTMPILADALQDAGCDNAEILEHCRGPGPHVRGCWLVDLLLGKE